MKILYFDCPSGIAGDMVVGAMLDLGLPFSYLKKELNKLHLKNWDISYTKTRDKESHIMGGSFKVCDNGKQHSRDYKSIRSLIKSSKLLNPVKTLAGEIFNNLAKAEAKVHGLKIDDVHFHEIGAVDSIIDVVGSAIGFCYFKSNVFASPIPYSRGKIKCDHGTMLSPAPATMELLKGIPLEKSDIHDEIVTPTGAAIISTIASGFGESPLQRIEKVGYGFGSKRFPGMFNAVRVTSGKGFPVVIVETNIDDMNPQIYDYIFDCLFKTGAIDVALIPVQMKKNRPATMIQCQVPWDKKENVINMILRETTSLGVRYYPVERKILQREVKTTQTKYGKVRIKIAYDEKGEIVKWAPEYEDVKQAAKRTGSSILKVLQDIQFKYQK